MRSVCGAAGGAPLGRGGAGQLAAAGRSQHAHVGAAPLPSGISNSIGIGIDMSISSISSKGYDTP